MVMKIQDPFITYVGLTPKLIASVTSSSGVQTWARTISSKYTQAHSLGFSFLGTRILITLSDDTFTQTGFFMTDLDGINIWRYSFNSLIGKFAPFGVGVDRRQQVFIAFTNNNNLMSMLRIDLSQFYSNANFVPTQYISYEQGFESAQGLLVQQYYDKQLILGNKQDSNTVYQIDFTTGKFEWVMTIYQPNLVLKSLNLKNFTDGSRSIISCGGDTSAVYILRINESSSSSKSNILYSPEFYQLPSSYTECLAVYPDSNPLQIHFILQNTQINPISIGKAFVLGNSTLYFSKTNQFGFLTRFNPSSNTDIFPLQQQPQTISVTLTKIQISKAIIAPTSTLTQTTTVYFETDLTSKVLNKNFMQSINTTSIGTISLTVQNQTIYQNESSKTFKLIPSIVSTCSDLGYYFEVKLQDGSSIPDSIYIVNDNLTFNTSQMSLPSTYNLQIKMLTNTLFQLTTYMTFKYIHECSIATVTSFNDQTFLYTLGSSNSILFLTTASISNSLCTINYVDVWDSNNLVKSNITFDSTSRKISIAQINILGSYQFQVNASVNGYPYQQFLVKTMTIVVQSSCNLATGNYQSFPIDAIQDYIINIDQEILVSTLGWTFSDKIINSSQMQFIRTKLSTKQQQSKVTYQQIAISSNKRSAQKQNIAIRVNQSFINTYNDFEDYLTYFPSTKTLQFKSSNNQLEGSFLMVIEYQDQCGTLNQLYQVSFTPYSSLESNVTQINGELQLEGIDFSIDREQLNVQITNFDALLSNEYIFNVTVSQSVNESYVQSMAFKIKIETDCSLNQILGMNQTYELTYAFKSPAINLGDQFLTLYDGSCNNLEISNYTIDSTCNIQNFTFLNDLISLNQSSHNLTIFGEGPVIDSCYLTYVLIGSVGNSGLTNTYILNLINCESISISKSETLTIEYDIGMLQAFSYVFSWTFPQQCGQISYQIEYFSEQKNVEDIQYIIVNDTGLYINITDNSNIGQFQFQVKRVFAAIYAPTLIRYLKIALIQVTNQDQMTQLILQGILLLAILHQIQVIPKQ
ncbi:UNKNOWN [Stylonychia lemnae]|uniref:Uncharacterized protein n=1 Tax=Stylonychia lemnae TaxID=5949 RepID=A0A078ABG0_STYLE|nr:UNKNOWN [Stylonychia lemnae]|eukprot:CDW78123.1 UNKNOWN [Stylonychia lemnae]